jgi:hypothetical protein
VLRFILPSTAAVAHFLAASRYTASTTSFGGLRSSADRFALTAGDGSAEVSWVEPADDGGATVSGVHGHGQPGWPHGVRAGRRAVGPRHRMTNGTTYRFTVHSHQPSRYRATIGDLGRGDAGFRRDGCVWPSLINEDFATSAAGLLPVAGGSWARQWAVHALRAGRRG